jgi:tetratricopeptide (TPR) repeat protein
LWYGLLPAQLIGTLLLLSGCRSTPPQPPTIAAEAGHRPAAQLATETLGERKLTALTQRQQAFFAKTDWDAWDQQREADRIARGYEALIADAPERTETYLLYGKFLRSIGETERANVMFIKANDLDPQLAVAKQQIGNYLAEDGDYGLALAYFLSAQQLEPQEPVYAFQTGVLLDHYRGDFIDSGIFTATELDAEMQRHLARAAELGQFRHPYGPRYAESFFDTSNFDAQGALVAWRQVAAHAQTPAEREFAQLWQARVWILSGQPELARSLLAEPVSTQNQPLRRQLLEQLEAL